MLLYQQAHCSVCDAAGIGSVSMIEVECKRALLELACGRPMTEALLLKQHCLHVTYACEGLHADIRPQVQACSPALSHI